MIEIAEKRPRGNERIARLGFAIEPRHAFEPLVESAGIEPGPAGDEGGRRRRGVPLPPLPGLVEHSVFGGIELGLCGFDLVGRFHPPPGSTGAQSPPHARLFDQMFGRTRDQRILKAQRADDDVSYASHVFQVACWSSPSIRVALVATILWMS